jgi:Ca-activated chloride channel family protein
MRLRGFSGAAMLVALPVWLAGGPASRQTPQFKSTADLVSVYATVRDQSGRLVPDLTKDDFVVTDNGRQQPLTFFTNDVHPFSAVIMLDRSGSMVEHHGLVRDAGAAFLRAMLPGDTARIGSFGDELRLDPAEFTSDQDALVSILENDLQRAGGASPVWSAFDRAISSLAERDGRRVLLALTDGYNSPRAGQPITLLEDVIRRARYNDILAYIVGFTAVDYNVPGGYGPIGRPPGRPPLGPPTGYPGLPQPPAPGRSTPSTVNNKSRAPYKGLRLIADETGGGYYELEPSDELAATFARIAEELHRQYWMAFTPARLDGRIHEIEVKVKRKGLDVRARKSYFADPKRRSKEPSPEEHEGHEGRRLTTKGTKASKENARRR